jgi:phosphoglycolate phosphatase
MPYQTLVFDLDGMLTDPLLGIFRCMNFALTSFDYPPRKEAEIIPFIGPPLEVALSALSGSDDETHVKALMATYRERYGELGFAENTVYGGIIELLDSLRERGQPMGVCTSKFEKYAIKVLEQFKLRDYFQFVSGGDYGIAKSRQLADLLAAGTITRDALMIGDRAVDLTAAHSNGLASAGVLWGYGSLAELSAESPAHLCESPAALLRVVTN